MIFSLAWLSTYWVHLMFDTLLRIMNMRSSALDEDWLVIWSPGASKSLFPRDARGQRLLSSSTGQQGAELRRKPRWLENTYVVG